MPKVLLIEDEESLRNLYTRILSTKNYEVEAAADGEIALSLLKQFRPDVIVLDIVMPHYNGVEILKILKNDGELKSIPVVMLTALSEMRKITECLDMGAVGYITKDSTVEEIVHRLNFLIESIGVQ
ncbi:MAG TPA: response regulator [Thermodesulfobacteriota bacterium]|jgi:DNA-binding response OmpR family regulator|nr:response regulator [Thermodesulfobacteriota bacterium]